MLLVDNHRDAAPNYGLKLTARLLLAGRPQLKPSVRRNKHEKGPRRIGRFGMVRISRSEAVYSRMARWAAFFLAFGIMAGTGVLELARCFSLRPLLLTAGL